MWDLRVLQHLNHNSRCNSDFQTSCDNRLRWDDAAGAEPRTDVAAPRRLGGGFHFDREIVSPATALPVKPGPEETLPHVLELADHGLFSAAMGNKNFHG